MERNKLPPSRPISVERKKPGGVEILQKVPIVSTKNSRILRKTPSPANSRSNIPPTGKITTNKINNKRFSK